MIGDSITDKLAAKKIQEAEAKRPENILKKQLMERKENAPPIYIPLEERG